MCNAEMGKAILKALDDALDEQRRDDSSDIARDALQTEIMNSFPSVQRNAVLERIAEWIPMHPKPLDESAIRDYAETLIASNDTSTPFIFSRFTKGERFDAE